MSELKTVQKIPSRFYKLGSHAMYMAGSFVYLAGGFRPEYVREALGSFSMVVGLLLGGAAWTNAKERDLLETRSKQGQTPQGEPQ